MDQIDFQEKKVKNYSLIKPKYNFWKIHSTNFEITSSCLSNTYLMDLQDFHKAHMVRGPHGPLEQAGNVDLA